MIKQGNADTFFSVLQVIKVESVCMMQRTKEKKYIYFKPQRFTCETPMFQYLRPGER